MGLRLFFLPNFPGAMFIQGGTFIPDSRVLNHRFDCRKLGKTSENLILSQGLSYLEIPLW